MKTVFKVPVEKILTGNILIFAESEDDALTIAREQHFTTSDVIDRDIYGEETWDIFQGIDIEETYDFEEEECLNYEQ